MSIPAANTPRRRNLRLKIAVFMPLLMVADVWLAQRLYPGFDQGSQFISELGATSAPHPLIFNVGMVLAGIAGIFAGHGFDQVLRDAGGRRTVSAFAGLWMRHRPGHPAGADLHGVGVVGRGGPQAAGDLLVDLGRGAAGRADAADRGLERAHRL